MTTKKKTKPRNAYQKSKAVTTLACEMTAITKWSGRKELESEFETMDPGLRKLALRQAIRDNKNPDSHEMLEALAAKHYPSGLNQRANGALPGQIKARTTKQQPLPFIVCRMPTEFEAVQGSVFDVKVDEKKKSITFTMAGD